MSGSNDTIPAGFRPVPEFPRYAINENGMVLSICPRNGRGKNRFWKDATIVKPSKDSDGYLMVCLCHEGRKQTLKIHSLVLTAFAGKCPNGMVCRHLDGNQNNNHISNLAWGSCYENSQDMILHGTSTRGEKHGRTKLTNADVLTIRARADNGETQTSIAKDFSISQSTVSLIVRREKWTHI